MNSDIKNKNSGDAPNHLGFLQSHFGATLAPGTSINVANSAMIDTIMFRTRRLQVVQTHPRCSNFFLLIMLDL